MFSQLAAKLSELGHHHQMAFTVIVTLSVICMSWAIERIFDHYIFTNKPLLGYLTVIVIALFLLWLTQHVILHVA
jgi:hypothetical protein